MGQVYQLYRNRDDLDTPAGREAWVHRQVAQALSAARGQGILHPVIVELGGDSVLTRSSHTGGYRSDLSPYSFFRR